MNGARTTFMRRGYLLTALAAVVLLAASPGTASAQSSLGFVGTSGSVAEAASFEAGAFEGPHAITIRGTGIPTSPTRRTAVLNAAELAVTGAGRYAIVNPAGGAPIVAPTALDPATAIDLQATHFNAANEATLLVLQGARDGATDGNWLDERITFTLSAGPATGINPNVYVVTVDDPDVAPVAKFDAPSFTLTEGSERMVALDIVSGTTGRSTGLPSAAKASTGNGGMVTISVSNHDMVTIGGADSGCAPTAASGTNLLGQTRKAIHIELATGDWPAPDAASVSAFGRTARLTTTVTVENLANTDAATGTADVNIIACDVAGFRNQSVTLTILGSPSAAGLVEAVTKPAAEKRGDITIGSPLTVTVDSDEAAPTLSFSPTDVTIDEGDSVSTRLIADGSSATEVGMVKLMVEGDAMVDLYHEDTMLEEMDGYVMVDMGMSNSVKLTAMSMSDPDLMDGDMAYKAWKLMEGSSDAMIGDDYWFRVDVRGSTAVPALPLVGQLLLALFLMAGGSRLYRRRNG